MSCEDEFELNYIKIDSKDEIKLLETDDSVAEISTLFSKVADFGQKKLNKNIIKDLEKNIPQNYDLLKYNIDFSKKFIKIINLDKKKNFIASVKRILSIDFEKEFIFNYTNIYDVSSIICLLFSEYKKYKISSIDDLKNIIKRINLQQYDFYRLYTDFSLKKKKTTISSTNKTQVKSSQINDNKTLEKNIKNNYVLNNEYSYINEDKENDIKIISKKIFIYPEYNKIGNKDPGLNKTELPIELILILRKLKDVRTLIFQIQNVENNYKNLAKFILSNIDWLFIKGINEVKFDINNEDIQRGLDESYNLITENYYKKYKIDKNKIFYNGLYSARNINCWVPESDLFFFDKKGVQGDDYFYKTQITDDSVIIKDYICNIYNAFGNLMNIRYIPKINFSLNNNLKNQIMKQIPEMRTFTQCLDDVKKPKNLGNDLFFEDFINESVSIFDIDDKDENPKQRRDSIFAIDNYENIYDMENIGKNYNDYFNMILIYSYYLGKFCKNIETLSMYFQNAFTYEINNLYKTEVNSEYIHFLLLLNKLENLKDINFSFNSLDDKSFEYILGILSKNSTLSKLRMSFFTPDINYYDNALFNLCSSKKLEPNKLFNEFSEYQRQSRKNKEKKINEYILEEILLNPFMNNLCNLSNLLKLQLLKNLEELIFRFDIPLPLINNQKYRIVIIKFIFDILIMLTFQDNRTNTFKILAPNLEINSNKMPFIKSFFNEISLTEEENNNETNQNVEIKTGETIEEIDNKEINDKKIESALNNNENKKVINKTDENKQQILSQLSKEKMKEFEKINKKQTFNKTNDFDINKQYIPKSSSEKAAIRKNLSEEYDNINSEIQLYYNNKLENLVIQLKIFFLPEIFNICKINNLAGLKYINLGNLDEISFKGFVDDYKLNCSKLKSLVTLKIILGFSVLSYDNLEKYIFDFINTNSPKLREKLLLSNLIIDKEDKMEKLIDLVYLKANIEKLIVKINNDNIDLLSKLLPKFIIQYRTKYIKDIYTLMLILNHPKCKKINEKEIIENLCDFIIFSKNKTILCDEIS